MCNAVVLGQDDASMLTLSRFREMMATLSQYAIPICTISGGEPTLVRDMPTILTEAAQQFRARVMLISNFYLRSPHFRLVMEAALRVNTHIVCSFDGFGEIADQLRGARDVAIRAIDNLRLVSDLRRSLQSRSILEMHTVISDTNLHQLPDILELSQSLGWQQTVAPKNAQAQQLRPATGVGLTDSPLLRTILDRVERAPNVHQMPAYIRGIANYANGTHEKRCPYLSPMTRHFKVFLEPNGALSLCDRRTLGNIFQEGVDAILSGREYSEFARRASACEGCWLSCFTEPSLASRPENVLQVVRSRGAWIA